MRFMLLLYQDEAGYWFRLTEAERERAAAAYADYARDLAEAGALQAALRFQPYTAGRTVRLVDGRSEVREGAYADTLEQLGGCFVIEAPDRDAAIAWAERCPAVAHGGAVELRPLWDMG